MSSDAGRLALQYGGYGIGLAFGGPLGASIGGAVGGMIAQALFPGPPQKNGQEWGLQISGSRYGSAVPQVYGTCMCAGNIVYSSGVSEHIYHTSGKGGLGGQQVDNYYYTTDLAILVCQGPVVSVRRIWANEKLILDLRPLDPNYPWASTAQKDAAIQASTGTETLAGRPITPGTSGYSSLTTGFGVLMGLDVHSMTMTSRIYYGTEDQTPDPLLQANLNSEFGSENGGACPAFRGTCYAVFENFQLTNYNNAVPNLRFEVIQSTGVNLGGLLQTLFAQVGVTPDNLDVSGVTSIGVDGLVVSNRSPLRDTLETLCAAYAFDLVESDGMIRAVRRFAPSIYTIPDTDMGARGYSDPPSRIQAVRQDESQLPQSVEVGYISPGFEYKGNVQRANRWTTNAQDRQSYNWLLCLSDNAARAVALRLLYEQWTARTVVSMNLPWRHMYLTPGDVINIPVGDQTYQFRLRKATVAMPGLMSLSGYAWDPDNYTQVLTGSSALSNTFVEGVPQAQVILANLPPLQDSDGAGPGIYWALGTDGYGVFRGGLLQVDKGDGRNFQTVETASVPYTGGTAITILPDNDSFTWDNLHTVDVSMNFGTLSSAPRSGVLNGENTALLGNEIIQFTTATQIGSGQYRLSGLLRGRKGTEHTTGTHASGEGFLLLDNITGAGGFLAMNLTDIDREYSWRGVIPNVDPTPFPIFPAAMTAQTLVPWSVCHVKGSRDGSNNLTVTWVRRTRFGGGWNDGGDVPLNESAEQYQMVAMNGASEVRTIVSNTPTATYLASDQIADFGATQSSISLAIYQISATLGRGRPAVITL